MWQKPTQVPGPGSRVRVTRWGDDHHREGTVNIALQGWLFIQFSPDREDRYHTQDVEVWK